MEIVKNGFGQQAVYLRLFASLSMFGQDGTVAFWDKWLESKYIDEIDDSIIAWQKQNLQ